MSVSVADLTAKLALDSSHFSSGMAAAEARAKSGASSIGGALTGIAHLALGAGTALAGGLAGGLAATIGPAMQFQSTLSGIKAVSGATAAQMQQISALALQLGKDTTFSAKAAGEGIEELIKGGVSIPDIMNGAAKATLNLAAAGGVDLPSAAEIAANALNMFSLKGKDMAHVSDLIAGAANASSISVMDFKFSLAASGATAATIGVSFDDLSVAIAELGAAGLKGSLAGTTLKSMFMALVPSTVRAKDEMTKLHLLSFNTGRAMEVLRAHGVQPLGSSSDVLMGQLSKLAQVMAGPHAKAKDISKAYVDLVEQGHVMNNAFFDQHGKIKSLAEVSGILHNAYAGMTKEQQIASMHIIFGSYAINAASVLARQGAEGFSSMASAMGKVTAESVAAERMNNLAGWIEQLKGSLETLAITIGMKLLPMLTNLAKQATAVVNSFIGWAEALPPGMLEWGLKVGAVAAAVLTFGGALALVLPALAPIGAILGALGLPLLAIGVAIGGLALAWTQNWGGIRDTVARAWSSVGPLLTQFKGAATALMMVLTGKWAAANAGEGLAKPFETAVNKIAGIFGAFRSGGLGTGLSRMMEEAKGGLGSLVGWMGTTALPAIGAAALRWGRKFITWVGPQIPPLLAALGDLLGKLGGWIKDTALPWIGTHLSAWGHAFTNWIGPRIPGIIAALGRFLGRVGNWIKDTALPQIGTHLRDWGGAFIAWVGPRLPGLLSELGRLLGRFGGWIKDTALPSLMTHLRTWGAALVGWIGPMVPTLLAAAGALVARLGSWLIGTGVPALIRQLRSWGSAFVAWIGPQIPPLLAAAGRLLSQLGGWITGTALPAVMRNLTRWATAFVAWVVPATTDLVNHLGPLLDRLSTWIGNQLPQIGKKLTAWGAAFWQWISDALPRFVKELARFEGKLYPWIIATAAVLGIKLVQWGVEFVKWVAPRTLELIKKLNQLLADLGTWIITTAVKELAKLAIKLGQALWDGMKLGLNDGIKGVKLALTKHMQELPDLVKNLLGIHSPSTVMEEVGRQAMAGLAAGIAGGASPMHKAMHDAVQGAVAEAVKTINGGLGGAGAGGTARRPTNQADLTAGGWQAAMRDALTPAQQAAQRSLEKAIASHPLLALQGTGPLTRGFQAGVQASAGARGAALITGPPAGSSGLGAGPLGSGGPVTIHVNVHPNAIKVQASGAGALSNHDMLGRLMGDAVATAISEVAQSQRRVGSGASRTLPGAR